MDGYSKRFGMIRVDYETQKRTPKLSYKWYRETIRQNRIA
jgi:beta-glucosidase